MSVVCCLLTWVAMSLPLEVWRIPREHYLPLHTIMEFLSVFVAFLVFATVWHTPEKEISGSLVMFALALLASGSIDILHALSFNGMPAFITPSSPDKSIAFWLVARALVALALLMFSLRPVLPPLTVRVRHVLLLVSTALVLCVAVGVIFYEDALPDMSLPGVGITPFKVGVERVITLILAIAAWRLLLLARRRDLEPIAPLFGATMLLLCCEVFLTSYQVSNDLQNMLGHSFKVAAYVVIYAGFMAVTVRRPYEALAAQALDLQEANERLRTQALALQTMVTPVLVCDAQGQVLWRNRASTDFIASGSTDFEQRLNLFGPPITLDPAVAGELRATLERGVVWVGMAPVLTDVGQQRWMRRIVTPLLDAQGRVQGYVSVSEDVTRQRQAQARHQRVLEIALNGFCAVSSAGLILEANPALARMTGYSLRSLVGMHVRILDGAVPEPLSQMLQAPAAPMHALVETRLRHQQGHDFPVEVSITRDVDSQQWYAFVRDCSERDRAAQARRELEQQLEHSQKLQALGQLTGGIAHDFNNILTAILGYSSLALSRLVPDKKGKLADYLREVVAASERGRDLIAKMLVFARTQPSDKMEVLQPGQVLEEAIAMLRPSISVGIDIHTAVEDDSCIRINRGELHQVLVNLLINARDAVGERGHITVRVHRMTVAGQECTATRRRFSGDFLAVDVSDSGQGIPAHILPRLFEPFFTTKPVGQGTGLGLPMVMGIVSRAGGYVDVASTEGSGSRFRLLFPLSGALLERPVSAPTTLPQAGGGQCVWVLDDEVAVSRYLQELLAGEGYQVRGFEDPEQLRQAFDAEPSSLQALITDQTMRAMSGIELAAHVHRVRPGLPILLCSGHADAMDAQALRALGICQRLTKPLQAEQVLEALAQALQVPAGVPAAVPVVQDVA